MRGRAVEGAGEAFGIPLRAEAVASAGASDLPPHADTDTTAVTRKMRRARVRISLTN